jgi:hypothetical protein
MRLAVAILALGALALDLQTAAAQHCNPGDIEIERSSLGVRCRPPSTSECLHRVGKEFPDKRKQLCSLTIGTCFNEKKAQLSAGAVACLASCLDPKELVMGRIDVQRCGKTCAVTEIMITFSIADKCLFDAVETCQKEALAQQRKDENNCRR